MQANELRIGNAVLFDGATGIVSQLRSDGAFLEPENYATYLRLSPIHLSPEILEQCGFVKDPDFQTHDFYDLAVGRHAFTYHLSGENLVYRSDVGLDFAPLCDCQYLHQLQNIIYAITGQDLVFKDTPEQVAPSP